MRRVFSACLLGLALCGTPLVAAEKKSSAKEKEPAAAAEKSTATKTTAKKETTAAKPAAKKEASGRLPRYFASLVDDAQRQEIYTIQERYRDEKAALLKQLEALEAKELSECEGVLTTAQKKELTAMRAKESDGKESTAAAKKETSTKTK